MARRNRTVAVRTLSSLVGLGVLAVVGFAIGVAAGGLWREPSLLASFVFGETRRVDWSSDSGGESLPKVAAEGQPAKRVESPAKGSGAEPRAVTPRATPAPQAPPMESGRYAVQVGAFAESRVAERLAGRLRAKGYPVTVSPSVDSGAARWRVRVGPWGSRDAAETAAARLKGEETLPTWVLNVDEQ